jgi:hypothetical protein
MDGPARRGNQPATGQASLQNAASLLCVAALGQRRGLARDRRATLGRLQRLYEWNDRINLNLALIGTYFGESARAWLDDNIYETFQRVGSAIEDQYRAAVRHEQIEIPDALETELLALNDQLYRLGVFMSTSFELAASADEPPIRSVASILPPM